MIKKLFKRKKFANLSLAISVLGRTCRAMLYNGFSVRLHGVRRRLPKASRTICNGYNEFTQKKKLNAFKLDLIATNKKFNEIETNRRLWLLRKKKLLGYMEIDKYLETLRRKKLEKSGDGIPNQSTDVIYPDLNLKLKKKS